jgi:23S rRNA (pseudouridine1915-N3)-methyltransferase
MRITIAAVGRMKPGPEADLTRDYLARAEAAGRGLGLGPVDLVEIDERKARDRAQQSARLIETLAPGAHAIALDERGKAMSSRAFAETIAGLRDAGTPGLTFLIGGADGHDRRLRERADRLLGLGPMVWPHMLVRAMLSEQVYRAVSILAGSPYHRD